MSGVSIWKDPRVWWDGDGGDLQPTLLVKRSDYNIATDAPLADPVPPIPQPFLRWAQGEYGGNEFVNDYWLKEHEENPLMDHLVVTVELVFGDDKVLFVANKDIKTKSETTGNEYAYYGALMDMPSFKYEANIGQNTSKARTFKVTVPNEYVDAIGVIKNDRMLAGYAEVSLQVDGGDYDRRFVVMRGSMDSGVNFGNTDGETVSVTIVDPKSIMSGSLPPYRVQESYPPPSSGGEPYQPFMFSPVYTSTDALVKIHFWDFIYDIPGIKEALEDGGAYSGQAYPPAAGVGRTYPVVWGYYPRVPCVPLVRDPHAVGSEFGGAVDDAYQEAWGDDDHCDHTAFYVVALGHGHKFRMYTGSDMFIGTSDPSDPEHLVTFGEDAAELARLGTQVFLSVPQIMAMAKKFIGTVPSVGTEVPTYAYGRLHDMFSEGELSHEFVFYKGGELQVSQDPWGAYGTTGTEPTGFTLLYANWDDWPCVLLEVTDPSGVPITVLRMSPKEGTTYTDAITIPMISSLGSTVSGDSLDPSASNSSIINCIEYFAKTYTTLGTILVDDQLFANAMSTLSNVTVSGLINGSGEASQAQTISFIEGSLLKSFPMVSMMFTGRGYGPVIFDRRGTITGEYIVGQGMFIDRISSIVETPKTKMFNDYTMRYDYNFDENDYRGCITRNSGNSIACKVSEEEAGRRTKSPVDSQWIQDRTVAERCVDWQCAHLTLPYYKVTYLAEVWALFRHSVGDNIKLTDERLGLSEATATITSIKYTPEACEVTLLLWLHYTKLSGSATNFPLPIIEGVGDPSPIDSESEEQS